MDFITRSSMLLPIHMQNVTFHAFLRVLVLHDSDVLEPYTNTFANRLGITATHVVSLKESHPTQSALVHAAMPPI